MDPPFAASDFFDLALRRFYARIINKTTLSETGIGQFKRCFGCQSIRYLATIPYSVAAADTVVEHVPRDQEVMASIHGTELFYIPTEMHTYVNR